VKKYVCHVRFVFFVFPRFHVWNPVFLSRKCFFLLLPLQAAGLLRLRFRAPNGVTSRAPITPGKFLRECAGLPRGTCDTCQLLIGRHRFEAYSACHVAKIDMCRHLISPRGTSCHVTSAYWSIPFFIPVGVDTWHTRRRY
jgi:hypothetical protein